MVLFHNVISNFVNSKEKNSPGASGAFTKNFEGRKIVLD